MATGILLNLVDDLLITSTLTPNETLAVGASEQPAVLVTRTVVDETVLAALDEATAALVVSAADTTAVQAEDAAPSVNVEGPIARTVTDSLTLVVASEATALSLPLALATEDSARLAAASEDAAIFGFTPQQEVFLTVTDTCKYQVLLNPPVGRLASDTCAVQLVEPLDQSLTWQVADEPALGIAEGAPAILETPPQVNVAVAETLALILLDQAGSPLADFGTTTDLLTVLADESAPLLLQAFATEESGRVAASEVLTAATALAAADTTTLGLTDHPPTDVATVAATETVAYAAQETTDFSAPAAVGLADSARLTAGEDGPLIRATAAMADALRCGINDAALLLLRVLAVSDQLRVAATEASSLFSNFVIQTAADAAAVQADDLIALLNDHLAQLPTTESLPIGFDDAPRIDSTDARWTDSLRAQAQEVVALLKALAVGDAAAYRIDSENVNVLNPRVIVIESTVEDALAVAAEPETVPALPTTLGLFVADEAAVGTEDVALTEAIEPPATAEFSTETTYHTQATPQSYRTVSSQVW